MEINEQDILDSISRNEKKSGLRLLGLLVVCLALGGLVLYFANSTKIAETKARKAEDSVSRLNKLLEANYKVLQEKDSLNNIAKENNNNKVQQVLVKEKAGNNVIVKEVKIDRLEETKIDSNALVNNSNEIRIRKSIPDVFTRKSQRTVVYIQAHGDNGKFIARTLQNRLWKDGYVVPQVESVKQSTNTIRYYFDEDYLVAQKIQKELMDILQTAQFDLTKIDYQPIKPKGLIAKQRQIEVWVSF
jgi:hypothetical protein